MIVNRSCFFFFFFLLFDEFFEVFELVSFWIEFEVYKCSRS